MATRRAEATWSGGLADGSGRASLASAVAGPFDVNWRARTEGGAETSPEELLAAAHASCFAMALSNELGEAHPPDTLTVSAEVEFGPVEGGFAVKSSKLTVNGAVPGVDAAAFEKAAQAASQGCPISVALKGNVDISVEAELAQG
jgi:osmotically inducible protein OsmC